ncbi:hypothetical protein HUG17_4327 [Dermatophagoides farinae]|uniref:MYND-type domain-containing protein n=1 Tax=Dermatophagoides farinae TaxID=6954 RepID=A0A9D4NZL3_DERFA|nr:hypothetical protein HUG17_4327 [Dermatophagoides farinae]
MHGSLAKKFQMIDHDVKQVIANVKRMNEKNDIKAIQFYNCSIREKDYHTKLSYINQAMIYGSNNNNDDEWNLLRNSVRQRATVFFRNQDYVNASHDLEWLLLTQNRNHHHHHHHNHDDWKLLKFAIISFYRLATKSLYIADYQGKKYAKKNIEKSEYFLQQLKILSQLNPTKYQMDLRFVYGQLNILNEKGEHRHFDDLREQIHHNEPDKQEFKKLNPTNIFAESNAANTVLIDDHGNLMAGRTINEKEKIFYEMIMTRIPPTTTMKNDDYKYCANCNRRLGYRFYPCAKCIEVVYCEQSCMKMSNDDNHHERICCLSPQYLIESLIENDDDDQQMAICYDLFAKLPLRKLIRLSKKYSITRAYHKLLKQKREEEYPLFAYYNMLYHSCGSLDLNQIDIDQKYYQKILIKSLQLSLIMKNQFNLTKFDLNVHDDGDDDDDGQYGQAELKDLIQIIPLIMVTLTVLDGYYLNQFIKQKMTIWKLNEQQQRKQLVGIGFGTFGLQLINHHHHHNHASPSSMMNVYRRFTNNGKFEYIATRRIEQGERLQWLSTSTAKFSTSDGDDEQHKQNKRQRRVHFEL